jgi:hypothetical protein
LFLEVREDAANCGDGESVSLCFEKNVEFLFAQMGMKFSLGDDVFADGSRSLAFSSGSGSGASWGKLSLACTRLPPKQSASRDLESFLSCSQSVLFPERQNPGSVKLGGSLETLFPCLNDSFGSR